MVPVVLAPRGKGIAIGVIGACIEHLAVRSIAGDTVAFEIGDVAGQRGRTEPRALLADNTGLDDDAPLERASTLLKRRPLPAADMSGAAPGLAATKRRLSSPSRDLEHPANQRACLAPGVRAAVTRAARPDVETIVSHTRWNNASAQLPLKTLGNSDEATAGHIARRRILLNKTNHLHPGRRRCFYLAILLSPF